MLRDSESDFFTVSYLHASVCAHSEGLLASGPDVQYHLSITPRTFPRSQITADDIAVALNAGALGKPLGSGGWMVPGPVVVEQGSIRWERGEETHEQSGDRGLIGRFSRLASATEDEIGDFARRIGVLFYLSDDRGHGDYCSACRLARGDSLHIPDGFQPLLEHGAEPVDAWRRLARDVGGCLRIAFRFRNDEPVTEDDWGLFGNLQDLEPRPGPPGYADAVDVLMPASVSALIEPNPTSHIASWFPPVEVLAAIVNLMIRTTSLRLVCSSDTTKLQIESGGLLGELGLQLGRLIGTSSAFAVCSGCGDVFAPTRRPKVGQRAWCAPCRERGLSKNAAQRKYRREKQGAAGRQSAPQSFGRVPVPFFDCVCVDPQCDPGIGMA